MNNEKLIQFDSVQELVGHNPKYFKDFCEAGIKSFTRFRNEYRDFLLNRNLDDLKETGHRIKPVAQMLAVDQINEEYQKAKKMLKKETPQTDLQQSVEKIEGICNQIILEFKNKLKSQ